MRHTNERIVVCDCFPTSKIYVIASKVSQILEYICNFSESISKKILFFLIGFTVVFDIWSESFEQCSSEINCSLLPLFLLTFISLLTRRKKSALDKRHANRNRCGINDATWDQERHDQKKKRESSDFIAKKSCSRSARARTY